MIFILTTQKESIIRDKFKQIPINYKFLDIDLLKNEFYDFNMQSDIDEKYENILLNQYIMKKIKNGIKNFKNTYFFYRIDNISINVASNVKKFVLTNHGHKINKFTILEDDDNIKKYYYKIFDDVYIINSNSPE